MENTMRKIFHAENSSALSQVNIVSLTCPSCKQNGSFERVAENVHDAWIVELIVHNEGNPRLHEKVNIGMRRCPNTECNAIIFVARDNRSGTVLDAYPKTYIEFDTTNVPENLVSTLQEAIICTAEDCHVAAAIMIRRTLEELCSDKGAAGDDLKQRLQDLANKIILPNELLDAAHDLRLLGNDAAHVEAKTYDVVGKDELLIAIELTKELIKASY